MMYPISLILPLTSGGTVSVGQIIVASPECTPPSSTCSEMAQFTTFPFVSKVYDIDFIETATKIFLGEDVQANPGCGKPLPYVGCKAPQFSFQRIHGADPVLGVEMASTGEVACFGRDKYEAFLKAYLSVPSNFKVPKIKAAVLSGSIHEEFVPSITQLISMGYQLHGEKEVLTKCLGKQFLKSPSVSLYDNSDPLFELISKKKVAMVFNFPDPHEPDYNYLLRRKSVDFGVPLMNNLRVSQFRVEAIKRHENLPCERYEEYYTPGGVPKRDDAPTNLFLYE